MPVAPDYRADVRHTRLGEAFFDPVDAAGFPKHILRYRNQRAARTIGLHTLDDSEWIVHFGTFEPLPDNLQRPLALRYHGHQFQHYNPHLGDGRGFLFAQMREAETSRLLDLGTKGSGQTPWSRSGDGRLTLKGAVREILAAELLEAQGVSTSRAFSVIETGEQLARNDEPSPTRSAVLVRLNHSNIRIGTFQRFAYLRDEASIAKLVDYAVENYFPQLAALDGSKRVAAFAAEVSRAVARTGARWLVAGFVHGVLNSDNINITGESFDYGPWRFSPVMDPMFTAAYFDQTSLYAFGRQPHALKWNLARLVECLLPFADETELTESIDQFDGELQREFRASILRRLGLKSAGPDADRITSHTLWKFLGESRAPFEQVFFDWQGGMLSEKRAAASPASAFYARKDFAPARAAFAAHEPASPYALEHSYFKSPAPCTLLIDEVEALWAPIAEADDWSAFHAKLAHIDALAQATGQR